MRRLRAATLGVTVSLLVTGSALAQATGAQERPAAPQWELTDGRWQPVNRPTTVPVADETLDRVEEMIQGNQGAAAKKVVLSWIRTQGKDRNAPNRDRAVFLLGQANFIAGNRMNAFYNFDEILDLYPESRYWHPSLDRQYEIADQFLKGYKRRFLGLAILEMKQEATEILYRVQQRAPGSPLAEKSLLRVADYYYANGDFDLAADAYAFYARNYPRSPYTPRVRLRQAFSALAQFRGVRFDATPVIEARQQLFDLMASYPRVADEENLPAIVQRIDASLAKKVWVTADFYRRTHKPTASAYYYKWLMMKYPNSPEAQAAPQKLAQLPDWAVRQAAPPGFEQAYPSEAAPATNPTNPEAR